MITIHASSKENSENSVRNTQWWIVSCMVENKQNVKSQLPKSLKFTIFVINRVKEKFKKGRFKDDKS